ncbi:hypothetical protein GCM10010168_52910 [Actinoplanes ianthinogenes]|uniref:Uncharacterized protein n=1 Tax=Actinoplanes ianthinogenes TaxID=122358 RepID=A0ABM7LR57_9ACTN|nr:hypothetical protein [Actinoplanes ianthinogenes]BCJ41711.1 hypothetical protein Aiant_23680 [Actinoplanes ianthinogenes]GGR28252.1 hypothetical protein GCM10010168_52910 [Actinoplanes ianthinogenes]
MTDQEPPKKRTGLLGLLLDAFDVPPVVRVGTTLVKVDWIYMHEGRAVIELEAEDMAVAVEQLVLDSKTAAKARMATSGDEPS